MGRSGTIGTVFCPVIRCPPMMWGHSKVSARTILAELQQDGFTVAAAGGRLLISPVSKLTDDLRAAVVAARDDLLSLLAQGATEEELRAASCEDAVVRLAEVGD